MSLRWHPGLRRRLLLSGKRPSDVMVFFLLAFFLSWGASWVSDPDLDPSGQVSLWGEPGAWQDSWDLWQCELRHRSVTPSRHCFVPAALLMMSCPYCNTAFWSFTSFLDARRCLLVRVVEFRSSNLQVSTTDNISLRRLQDIRFSLVLVADMSRAAHRVRLRRIDGSVKRAPSPYRLGVSKVSWRTVDGRGKAVFFRQVTGVNGVDGRHRSICGVWNWAYTQAAIAFQRPRTPQIFIQRREAWPFIFLYSCTTFVGFFNIPMT